MTLPAVLWLALVAVEVAAVGLAVWRAGAGRSEGLRAWWRRVRASPLAPVAVLLSFALVDELVLEVLHAFVFAGAPRPLAGWHRAAWHVETLFVLGWPAALAAVCAPSAPSSSSSRGRPKLSAARPLGARDVLLACYLAAVAGLAIVYPIPAVRLRWIFLGWEVACVGIAWWGIARRWGAPWGPVERCLVILAACETMVATVGPFASDPFTRWWVGSCFYLAAWGGCCGVLMRAERQ